MKNKNSDTSDGKKKCGLPMEVYSRVVGYYRPTKYWNKGKQEEFKQRKTFDLEKAVDEES